MTQRDSRLEKIRKKALRLEKSLQQSEDRFFKMFNFCTKPLLITTVHEGHVLDANKAFLRFFGYSRSELVGRTTTECGICIHPKRRKTYAQIVQKKAVRDFREQLRSKSGQIRNVLLTADTLRINDEVCILSMATCEE